MIKGDVASSAMGLSPSWPRLRKAVYPDPIAMLVAVPGNLVIHSNPHPAMVRALQPFRGRLTVVSGHLWLGRGRNG